MHNTISIAPIQIKHLNGFHALLDIVAREQRYLALTEAPSIESTRAFVESNIKNNIPQLVALAGDKVVGWCDISPMRRTSMAHCGELGMGVHPDYRRQGIGQRLLNSTVARAKETGMTRIELEVIVSNTGAILLYTKSGFVVEGIKKKALCLSGQYHDLMTMALLVE